MPILVKGLLQLELLGEKEEMMSKAMPEMQKKYEATPEKEEAYIYRGIHGFKNYLSDILKTKRLFILLVQRDFGLI